jgi:hypothetical protein
MPSRRFRFYDLLVDDPHRWPKAHRELLKLLFEDAGGRFEPAKHGEIHARLAELHEILNLPVPRHMKVEKKRTRFGDKKLPIAEGSHGTYSKMQRGENLAGIWMGLGLDKGESHLFNLPRDAETERLYLELHQFALDPEDHQSHELADALKAYFHEQVKPDETPVGVSMRLYCVAQPSDDSALEAASVEATWDRDKLNVATQFLRVKGLICELEELRTTFRDKCAAAMPLLESVLEPFKTDADEDDEAACAAPEGAEVDEDEDESEEEEDAHDKRVKKLKSIDPSERTQTVDLFFNKLRPPKGTRDARQNAFKGEAGPHIAELFYGILHRSQGRERLPVVQAPTYEQGAELRWVPETRADADRRLWCELKPPPEHPEADTVVTAKIRSMPNAAEIEDAYCALHTLARRLNAKTRDVVQYLLNTFSLAVCLHVAKCPSLSAWDGTAAHNVYQYDADTTFAQEMVLYQVYMDAIFTPSEEGEGEGEGEEAEGGEEEASSSESDPEDGDYDEEAGSSGPSDDDDDSDADDDDDDASADSDDDGSDDASGADSDSESDN